MSGSRASLARARALPAACGVSPNWRKAPRCPLRIPDPRGNLDTGLPLPWPLGLKSPPAGPPAGPLASWSVWVGAGQREPKVQLSRMSNTGKLGNGPSTRRRKDRPAPSSFISILRESTPSMTHCRLVALVVRQLLNSRHGGPPQIVSREFSKPSILRLDHGATLPRFTYSGDAGLDLYSSEGIVIEPRGSALVRTGILTALATGTEGQRRVGRAEVRRMISLIATQLFIDRLRFIF